MSTYKLHVDEHGDCRPCDCCSTESVETMRFDARSAPVSEPERYLCAYCCESYASRINRQQYRGEVVTMEMYRHRQLIIVMAQMFNALEQRLKGSQS